MEYDISIIIPLLNEKDNLKTLVSELNDYIPKLKDKKVEVLFVDDGSTDGPSEILQNLTHASYRARIVKLSKNYGSHAALRAGILHSEGDFVIFVFADLQDPLELVERLYVKCREGYDIAIAHRDTVQSGILERFFSRLYAKLMKFFVVSTFPENGFDIVMFNKKVKNELNQNIENYSPLFLQILKLGFRQTLVTYHKNARISGKSKWTLSKKIKMVIDSFIAFSYAPIRFVSLTGIILALLGFIWMSYLIIRTVIFKDLSPGWPSLIAILMIGFGITNISLGIIAEYLWRTLDVSRNRKAFIVDEIISCEKVGLK